MRAPRGSRPPAGGSRRASTPNPHAPRLAVDADYSARAARPDRIAARCLSRNRAQGWEAAVQLVYRNAPVFVLNRVAVPTQGWARIAWQGGDAP